MFLQLHLRILATLNSDQRSTRSSHHVRVTETRSLERASKQPCLGKIAQGFSSDKWRLTVRPNYGNTHLSLKESGWTPLYVQTIRLAFRIDAFSNLALIKTPILGPGIHAGLYSLALASVALCKSLPFDIEILSGFLPRAMLTASASLMGVCIWTSFSNLPVDLVLH